MAIEPRKRKKGVVYGVSLQRGKKRVWELVGGDKRVAKSRERELKKELAEGTYVPRVERKRWTVGAYADDWAAPRRNAWANEERRLIRLHINSRGWLRDMPLDEMRPRHTQRLVDEMRQTKRAGSDEFLSDSTISNVVGILKLVFAKAELAELVIRNPIQLPPRYLKRRAKEEEEPYLVSEAIVLMRHHAIPWGIRVLNAMCLLTGMRQGEAASRRWRDLEETCGPLECINIYDQWGGRPLKTERPRRAPIHPELAAVLTDWAREGFELYTGRKPEPDDFIVPNVTRRATKPHHTRSSFYKAFVKYAEAAGVRPRTQHACRHTFLSLLGRAGGTKSIYEKITHNAKGDIIDRYTHIDWEPLCQQVLLVDLNVRGELPPQGGSGSKPSETQRRQFSSIYLNATKTPVLAPASIPGASTNKARENSSNVDSRGDFRGDSGRGARVSDSDLKAANRRRKRELLSLAEADPEAAKLGLALCRGLDAAYRLGAGDESAADKLTAALIAAERALGGGKP